MKKRERYQADLAELVHGALEIGKTVELEQYIAANSNLPGPRGNLELALAFGDVIAKQTAQATRVDALWNLCAGLAEIPPEAAPVNDPRELIPFCAVIGLGAIGSVVEAYCQPALARLHRLAGDPRWRMREAVCFGLQRLLETQKGETLAALESWVAAGDLLQMRAAAAGLAEPALLDDQEIAMAALQLHRDILARVSEAQDRRSDAFRTLRKGLGYTLSVVVCAAPDEGFELLAELAKPGDRDVNWIVKQNLKKNRLLKRFPDRVAVLRQSV